MFQLFEPRVATIVTLKALRGQRAMLRRIAHVCVLRVALTLDASAHASTGALTRVITPLVSFPIRTHPRHHSLAPLTNRSLRFERLTSFVRPL
eukprot:4310450-Pleurochrysis_carterae.AAC.1